MDKKSIGFHKLVDTIGRQFFAEHEDSAVYSYGEEPQGLFCFLGIALHPCTAIRGLSATMDEWDIYASCYVTDNGVIMGKCKLPSYNEISN